jgi:hypothetical protein
MAPPSPKVSRWFRSLPILPQDQPETMLRVSRYFEEVDVSTPDGSVRVPAHHVRISIWSGDHALAALSIPDDEARELATFLAAAVAEADPKEVPTGTPTG